VAVDVTAPAASIVHVTRSRPIRGPRANDTSWIGGLRSARLLTPGPVRVGSQVERVAAFLGCQIEYVNEITSTTTRPRT
jgi:hypothetical protein